MSINDNIRKSPGGDELPHTSQLSVLIVDDDIEFQEILTAFLDSLDVHDVCVAGNGIEALELIDRRARNSFDLIIVDLEMPECDGIELIHALAKRPGSTIVPMSAHDPRMLAAATGLATHLGLETLSPLCKPLDFKDVARIVQEILAPSVSLEVVDQELTTEQTLDALEAGKLDTVFQPKIDLGSGKCIGVEALARIREDNGIRILPGRFITAAERASRCINQLTEQVARKSFSALEQWRHQGLDLRLSFNIAMNEELTQDLPALFELLARHHEIRPEQVTAEITESRVNGCEQLAAQAVRLRLKGFGLSVDDFGTGESGLSRLQALPFTELKIDRRFVTGASDRSASRTILKASIQLAHQMNMGSVAEGVETEEDLALLKSLGCQQAQGFLVAAGLSEEAIPGFVRNWNSRDTHSSAEH